MTGKIFTSGLMVMLLYVPVLAADDKANRQNINTLPWEIIAEKFDAKELFCTVKSKAGNNFALDTNGSIIALPLNIKIFKEQTKAELHLSVWQQGQWTDFPPLTVQIDPGSMTVDSDAFTDGFYNLSLVFDKKDVGIKNNFYAVVSADWKKDLFAYCRDCKEQIETNPDSQLIYSSIAVSHFDNLMELASKSSILSEEILKTLSKAITCKAEFEQGKCPDLVKGLNKLRLKRFEGATIVEFVVYIPDSLVVTSKIPLILDVDPRRTGAPGGYQPLTKKMIYVWWHFPKYVYYDWKDFQCIMNTIKQSCDIDEDRIYLRGECANGIAAMEMAFKYPDLWAECSISTGNSHQYLMGNVLNTPFILGNVHNGRIPKENKIKFLTKCLDYYGCLKYKSDPSLRPPAIRGTKLPQTIRDRSPRRVFFRIDSLDNRKAYWLKVLERKNENLIATIDATADSDSQTIHVKTSNINSYQIDLCAAPVDSNLPVEIIENDTSLGKVRKSVFTRNSQEYIKSKYVKDGTIKGPVWDALKSPFVLVYGTEGENQAFNQTCQYVAESIAKDAICIPDSKINEEHIKGNNLVLVGSFDSNGYLRKIMNHLPVSFEKDQIVAGERKYTGRDLGCIFVYPNPENPKKYIVGFTATSKYAIEALLETYDEIKKSTSYGIETFRYDIGILGYDIGIFRLDERGDIIWYLRENFDTSWNWHKKEHLFHAEYTYPVHIVNQWIAKVIMEELESDWVICRNFFNVGYGSEFGGGEVTLSDLINRISNNWLLKIEMKGRDLQMFLLSSVMAEHKKLYVERECDSENGQDLFMRISKIKPDAQYKIILDYKSIDWETFDIPVEKWRILDEEFLIPTIQRHIQKQQNYEFDSNVKKIRSKIL